MTESIDVLLIEPSDADARRTMAAIRQAKRGVSVVRVLAGDQAARLMFEHGLFKASPQVPSLIIVDLPAAGDEAKRALTRLKSLRLAHPVALVIFSARRTGKDILAAHLLGAHWNVQKPEDPADYASAVKRIMQMWASGSLILSDAEAS